MAYFPNGTSGMAYEADYCASCAHFGDGESRMGCPIWLLHMLYNYDQCRKGKTGRTIKTVLSTLIPETEDGLGAEKCSMFLARVGTDAEEAEQRRLAEQPAKYQAALAETRAA